MGAAWTTGACYGGERHHTFDRDTSEPRERVTSSRGILVGVSIQEDHTPGYFERVGGSSSSIQTGATGETESGSTGSRGQIHVDQLAALTRQGYIHSPMLLSSIRILLCHYRGHATGGGDRSLAIHLSVSSEEIMHYSTLGEVFLTGDFNAHTQSRQCEVYDYDDMEILHPVDPEEIGASQASEDTGPDRGHYGDHLLELGARHRLVIYNGMLQWPGSGGLTCFPHGGHARTEARWWTTLWDLWRHHNLSPHSPSHLVLLGQIIHTWHFH